jgi:hypothetical protein
LRARVVDAADLDLGSSFGLPSAPVTTLKTVRMSGPPRAPSSAKFVRPIALRTPPSPCWPPANATCRMSRNPPSDDGQPDVDRARLVAVDAL